MWRAARRRSRSSGGAEEQSGTIPECLLPIDALVGRYRSDPAHPPHGQALTSTRADDRRREDG